MLVQVSQGGEIPLEFYFSDRVVKELRGIDRCPLKIFLWFVKTISSALTGRQPYLPEDQVQI